MQNNGKLGFELLDVFGQAIRETATITLECQDLTDKQRADADASRPFVVGGLWGPPQNLYKVQIEAPGYLAVRFFASAQEAGNPVNRVVFLAVDPDKVIRTEFPAFESIPDEGRALLERSQAVLGFEGASGAAFVLEAGRSPQSGVPEHHRQVPPYAAG